MERDDQSTKTFLSKVRNLNTIDPARNPEIVADYLNGYINQQFHEIMVKQKINQKDLARRIGRSKQYVSKILNERQNFTVTSLSLFACALDCDLRISITPGDDSHSREEQDSTFG